MSQIADSAAGSPSEEGPPASPPTAEVPVAAGEAGPATTGTAEAAEATVVAAPPAVPPNVAAVKPGQWTVPRPAGTCMVTGRPIAPGERFWAAVRDNPGGIERLDVLADHWDAMDKSDLLASWQTTMPVGEEKKKRFVDDDVLCTLFEKLAEATEPSKLNFRFVLGLILMRKRLVLYDRTRQEPDGRDVWVVRMRGRQDQLELVDPKLNAEQTLEVSQQLGQVLNEEM